MQLLLVEDDPAIAALVVRGLRREGFEVELVADGLLGREKLTSGAYALAIVDLMLPGLDGYGILEAARSRTATPILVISARSGLDDRLRVFQSGAVDYLPKPFYFEELLARVRARVGAQVAPPRRVVVSGALEVDLDRRQARVDGVDCGLTTHEFNVLAALAERPGQPLTRIELVNVALGVEGDTEERTVDSHVVRIRRKLGSAGVLVETVRHLGYRLRAE